MAKQQKKRSIRKIDGIPVYCSHDAVVKITDLRPNPDNPNRHPDEQIQLLSRMIRENGWRDRITVSNLSGMIVKGHGRYLAAIRAGLSMAPVDYQDYKTEVDEITDLIGDNKISEFSVIDEDAARRLIEGLNMDFDFELAGFLLENSIEHQKKKLKESPTNDVINEIYGIYIECESEVQQVELLERFNQEGLSCRALIS